MLTDDEIKHYNRDGYVTPNFRLPTYVIDDIGEAHTQGTGVRQKTAYSADWSNNSRSSVTTALLAFDTRYLTVARMPEIMDMVCQVIGEDVALWNSSFFAKPARVGTKTPWHQDGEYWPIEPLATLHHMDRQRRGYTRKWLPAGHTRLAPYKEAGV